MAGSYRQRHPEHTVFYQVKFLHTATGFELMPGVVAVIQTFGDRINGLCTLLSPYH